MPASLVDVELGRHDWGATREAAGSGSNLPASLRALFAAPTPEAAEEAYWRLENHVVVQGQLFDAAALVVPVLLAALAEERPRHVRIAILDLLFQIVSGEPHREEVARGNDGLAVVCRERAREGLWTLYGELLTDLRDAARDVIEVVEFDRDRLVAFLDATERA